MTQISELITQHWLLLPAGIAGGGMLFVLFWATAGSIRQDILAAKRRKIRKIRK